MGEIFSTGIEGLDVVLHGGLMRGHTYLIAGTAGSGKTIFSIQWLLDGVKKGETCMFISMAEPAEQLQANVSSFSWDISAIRIVDLSPGARPEVVEEYHVLSPAEVEPMQAWQSIYEAIDRHDPQRLVIDSVTFMSYLSADTFQFRKQLLAFVNYLKIKRCTAFLIYEPEEMNKDVSLPLTVDGVIMLRKILSSSKVLEMRSLEVQKLRGRGYWSGLHPMRITHRGIIIYPHIVEQMHTPELPDVRISSGIPRLDEMLHGGIEANTVTLITGPTGVGKSSLATQFTLSAAREGRRVVYYSFEETPQYIIRRANGIRQNIVPYIENELINIRHINPLELFPDELLSMIRADASANTSVLVLDSIRGYQIAMEQFGNMDAHIQNMVSYLKSAGITTFFINELEYITSQSIRLTELGISFIVDNALLLRFAEKGGKIIRIIGCIKKRLGTFEPEAREFELTEQGIQISEKLPQCSLFGGTTMAS
ncbi:MAG: ATPase domain-containing protein [Bacteroidales bacterium]